MARLIIEELDVPWVTLLSMDSFYRVKNAPQFVQLFSPKRNVFLYVGLNFQGILSDEEIKLAQSSEYNFDHPDAFDFDLLKATITRLKEGKKVDVPIYNFKTHKRESRTVSSTIPDLISGKRRPI